MLDPRLSSRALVRALVGAAIGLLTLGPWYPTGEPVAEAKEKAKPKPAPQKKGVFEYGCRVQAPQRFLERRGFMHGRMLDSRKQGEAVRWLSQRYGHADDEVTTRWNPVGAFGQAKSTHFMGLPISIHAKIAPALACVEKRIQKTCTGSSRYVPRAIGGFRQANTYRGTEVSNHLFGIAIDIDPDRNPCCGCVDPWPSNPVCKASGPVYKRTALPKCWVKSFERFGFDWLGHDILEDTMHFEFLGDPERITR